MIFWRYILVKITNQSFKLKKIRESIKLNNFQKKLNSCGKNVFIRFPVCFEGIEYISLGNNVSINAFVHIWGHGGVEIGDNTLIASHVSIVSVTHDTNASLYSNSTIKKKIVIGNNVWIGTHVTILPGVKIGDNAIIGAGSVVTKNIESNSVVTGIPAKLIRKISSSC